MFRLRQIVFVISSLAICWYGMMLVHELGHVVGAILTNGHITCIVLHPLAISRTDVLPNPRPAVVVWMGPIIGCILPLATMFVVPEKVRIFRSFVQFFAGFCLLANGAYISIGSIDRIGDCGEMLRTGTPLWIMQVFGLIAIPMGLMIWHRLGSVKQFMTTPDSISFRAACLTPGILFMIVMLETLLSPRQ